MSLCMAIQRGFHDEWAEMLVTPVYLLSADLPVTRVMTGRNKPEDGNKTTLIS